MTALAKHIRKHPEELWRPVTWDRGHEMARHKRCTFETNVAAYICDLAAAR